MTAAALTENLSRADVRARLAAPRKTRATGDNATAQYLAQAGGLSPADESKFTFLLPGTPWPPRPQSNAPTPAAVLVPLVERPAGFTVLLTQRTADLKAHAGQISFPGGKMEAFDADAVAGALRETAEEIGLDAAHIEILGQLDHYMTVTNFDVTPVVAAVTPPFELTPDPVEVADIFEVPLAFFLDPANHQRHSRKIAEGVVRGYYAMPYGDRYIWGATAGMLINLYDVLTAPI